MKYRITLDIEVHARTAGDALASLSQRDLVFQVTSESGAQFDLLAQHPIRGIVFRELATRQAFPMRTQA